MYNRDLYLFITNSCPNRCKYCYIKYGHLSMTKEDIDKNIKKYKPHRVIFFGGEPLVRLDLIKYSVEKYKDSGIIFQIVTSTMANWEEFIDYYVNHHDLIKELQISWDGYHDSRITKEGKPISSQVWDNMINLYTSCISKGFVPNFDIKTVICNYNVEDMVKLHIMYRNLDSIGIHGQFVIAHGEDYWNDFYDHLEALLPLTFDLDKMYVDHMNKIISYLEQGNGCSCDIGKYITVTPDGKEDICTALSQCDHSIDFQASQERCLSEDCQNCEYKYICDGGCRYERYLKFGKDWSNKHLESTCKIMKIWDNSIKKFLDSLDKDGKKKLMDIIKDYKQWKYKRYNINL